eukprot:789120-Pyramimonas_sp.AAC.1
MAAAAATAKRGGRARAMPHSWTEPNQRRFSAAMFRKLRRAASWPIVGGPAAGLGPLERGPPICN